MRLDHVVRFAREHQPDVLCLQELKLTDEQFPSDVLRAAGFAHLAWHGQQAYNGVAMLSKLPLEDVQRGFVGVEDPEARILAATVAGIRIYGLYCPNGQEVGHPKFLEKLRWFGRLRTELDRFPRDAALAVVGDFNVAPDDLDVWDPFRCDGILLCHPDERAALAHVVAWGLRDPFRERNPFANAFTWWDYQKMGFVRNHGLRIDHTLLSEPLMARVKDVVIHRDVRGWDQPSDHAPVSVDLA
jgi:exodeoxyribonuclease-3